MQKTKWWLILLTVATTVMAGVLIYNRLNTPKMAYVRTQYLILNHKDFKKEKLVFEKKVQEWNGSIDTLSSKLGYLKGLYKGSPSVELEKQIRNTEADLSRLSNYVAEQGNAEEKRLIESSNFYVNAAVAKYAREHNIDMIIGTTDNGLVFGNPAYDVTEDILKDANGEGDKK